MKRQQVVGEVYGIVAGSRLIADGRENEEVGGKILGHCCVGNAEKRWLGKLVRDRIEGLRVFYFVLRAMRPHLRVSHWSSGTGN